MSKEFQDLTFTDDFIFCKVLTLNPDLCEEMLRIILEKNISIVMMDNQKSVKMTPDGKGVRLDVYVEDDEKVIYDIEMQTTVRHNLAKRSRYYQGVMDMHTIEAGKNYSELRKSYVIFICTFDYFGLGIPVYTFKSICEQQTDLVLHDDAVKIFINPNGDTSMLSEELRAFLEFMIGKEPSSEFTKQLQEEIDMIKKNPNISLEYMSINAREFDLREEGRAEGREEGHKEGVFDTIVVFNMIKDNQISLQEGAKRLNISEAELKKML